MVLFLDKLGVYKTEIYYQICKYYPNWLLPLSTFKK